MKKGCDATGAPRENEHGRTFTYYYGPDGVLCSVPFPEPAPTDEAAAGTADGAYVWDAETATYRLVFAEERKAERPDVCSHQ